MGTLNLAAMASLHDHSGAISIAQLDHCVVSRRLRQELITDKILIPVHRGVYRIASQPLTLATRCAALSLFLPTGYVTGPTGGKHFELRRMPTTQTKPPKKSKEKPIEIVHYAMPHPMRMSIPGVKIRQTTIIEPTDRFTSLGGILLASPWRLAFDLAGDLGPLDLASVIEQILANKLCTVVTLAATSRRLSHPARPGSKEFAAALASRVPGGPLESHPEVRVAKALRDLGIPIVAQVTWLDLPDGTKARLDISVPAVRWGLEVDVHPDHFLLFGSADRYRDRQCNQVGWQVNRVTAVEMLDFDALMADLVRTYEARVAEISGRGR